MKKSHIYALGPIIGLIVFCAFYIPFARRFDQDQAAKQAAIDQKRQQDAMAQAEARREAIIKANEDADRRRKEREAKAAQEKAEKDAFDAADAERTKAFNDEKKFRDQADAVQKQIEGEQKAIADLEHQKQEAQKEQDFLKSYIQQAQTNVQNISSLLDKLAAAEKARADADAAIKKAAANNS
ncbi:MAG TPA: hypothetical protein VFB27_08765 [Opitutaceae bacterium]|nr:hypothetical protein [Opitutaceae bacterium]